MLSIVQRLFVVRQAAFLLIPLVVAQTLYAYQLRSPTRLPRLRRPVLAMVHNTNAGT